VIKEYAIRAPLSPASARAAMKEGKILITGDGKERAMRYKKQFTVWLVGGKLGNVLVFLSNYSGWYVQEREDFPHREIVTVKNTDISILNKCYFE
jgi:hypothetical protein